LPGWLIAWDVFCWIGHRRFARHWSIPQINDELLDSYRIKLSPDALSIYIRRYQNMLAARQQDFANLQSAYKDIDCVDLTIDGLQPEKGHETLYAVRELRAKRVWFAEALLSSSDAEVRRLLVRADEMAKQLGKTVRLWMSDKQDAFVNGIALQFAGVPHLYCGNHFLRGLAKPTLEADSRAKVTMRSKVRNLRDIERSVLKQRRHSGDAFPASTPRPAADAAAAPPEPRGAVASQAKKAAQPEMPQEVAAAAPDAVKTAEQSPSKPATTPEATSAAHVSKTTELSGDSQNSTTTASADTAPQQAATAQANDQAVGNVATGADDPAGQIVLDYCAAVRGILNDDQGGPLEPPGLRMAEALVEVRESLQRNLDLNKPGPAHGQLERLAGCIDKGLEAVKAEQQEVKEQCQEIQRVAQTLDAELGTLEQRKEKFEELQEEFEQKGQKGEKFYEGLAKVMMAWAVGLFMKVEGMEEGEVPGDNLEMERWFKNPKGHERRIHGHKHAGVRIVQEGPTLLLTLDAHLEHDGPFTAEELLPYRHAQAPKDQQEAINRRKVMRKARSKKNEADS
jgi:prefoldin subunit 5